MQLIRKYFPDLTSLQYEQLEALGPLYTDWNSKINVISRKDIDNLYEHHVLHSLAIAKIINFRPGTSILDFGTGGGFPGIPLAIAFPKCHFTMIDGTGKWYCAIEKYEALMVDLKFVDPFGKWQHFSVPLHELTETIFTEGFGIDGSSNAALLAIEILSLNDDTLADKLDKERKANSEKVLNANTEVAMV